MLSCDFVWLITMIEVLVLVYIMSCLVLKILCLSTGLKRRVSQLEATCEMQQEELTLLRRDMRVTRTRVILCNSCIELVFK